MAQAAKPSTSYSPKATRGTTSDVALLKEGISVLRKENELLKTRLRVAQRAAVASEAQRSRAYKRLCVEQEERDVLYIAVSVLAAEVGTKTQAQKRARESARQLLEEKKIKPPSTLGSSRPARKTKKKTRRRKKKS